MALGISNSDTSSGASYKNVFFDEQKSYNYDKHPSGYFNGDTMGSSIIPRDDLRTINTQDFNSEYLNDYFDEDSWVYKEDDPNQFYYPQLSYFTIHPNEDVRKRSLRSVDPRYDNDSLDGLTIIEDGESSNLGKSDEYSYSLKDVDVNEIEVIPVLSGRLDDRVAEVYKVDEQDILLEDNKIQVSSLKVGSNEFFIRVYAEDLFYKDYGLDIYVSNNVDSLNELEVKVNDIFLISGNGNENEITQKFEEDIYSYDFNLSSEYIGGNIEFTNVSPEDSNSKVILPTNTKLKDNLNTFIIVVISEDGKHSKTYEINIMITNTDTTIKNVGVNNKSIGSDFDEYNNFKYSLDKTAKNSISINVITNNEFATVTINGSDNHSMFDIVDGENKFTIIVTASDGITKEEYTLILVKPSSDTSLGGTIDDDNIVFINDEIILDDILYDKSSFVFDFDKHEKTTLSFNATNSSFKDNVWTVNEGLNILVITVTAENDDTKTYTIKVNKEKAEKDLSDLTVSTIDGLDLPFENLYQAGVFNYSIIVDSNIQLNLVKLMVELLNDNQSTDLTNYEIVINSDGSGKINQTIKFVLLYRGIEVQEYTILITKGLNKSDHNELLGINLVDSNNKTIDLERDGNNFTIKDILEFNVNVLYLTVSTHSAARLDNVHGLIANIKNNITINEGKNVFTFTIYSESNIKGKTYTLTVEKAQAVKDAYLDSLTILVDGLYLIHSDNSKSPLILFESNKFTYDFIGELKLNRSYLNEELTFNYEKIEGTEVEISTIKKISDLINQFTIKVTAESGDSNVYVINIHIGNTEVLVDDILIEGENVTLDENNIIELNKITDKTKSYILDVNVNADIKYSEYSIEYYVNDKLIFDNQLIDYLEFKVNDIKVLVIPEDGNEINTKTYMFTLLKEDTRSKDNKLGSILLMDLVNNNELTLNKIDEFNYTVDIPYEVNKLSITVSIHELAKLVSTSGLPLVGNKTLEFDLDESTEVKFKIEAENGDVSNTYTIKLNVEKPSNDSSLASVVIDGVDYDNSNFNNNTMDHEMEYVDNLSIELVVVPTDGKASYLINNSTDNKTLNLAYGDNVITFVITAEDGSTENYTINILTKSKDNTINDIKIDGNDLDPKFDGIEQNYTYEVNGAITEVEIEVVSSIYPIITGAGLVSLDYGVNTFTVYATNDYSDKGTEYTIVITRLSDDTTIDNIEVDGEGITFDPITKELTIKYPFKDGDSIVIDITLGAGKSVSGDGNHNLAHGNNNTFIITITAEDGTVENYTLYVEALYDDNTITDIELDGYNISFNESILEYSLDVPYTVQSLDVAVLTHDFATVTVEKDTNLTNLSTNNVLEEGVNKFNIYSTSEYGTKGTVYKLTVNKEAAPKNSSTKILNIEVVGYTLDPKFDINTKEYNIKVGNNVTNLDIRVHTDKDLNQVITITGHNDLLVGDNIVTITVTSEDGLSTVEYTVNVNRADSNKLIIILIVTFGSIAVIGASLGIFLYIKSKKKNSAGAFEIKVNDSDE